MANRLAVPYGFLHHDALNETLELKVIDAEGIAN